MLRPGRAATRVSDLRCLIFSCVAALLLLGSGAGAQGAAGTSMLVSVQPVGNTIKGRPMDVQPAVTLELSDGSPDVVNAGSITAFLGLNPTASQLRGNTAAKLVNGVATFTDLSVFPGGSGFKLNFTAMSSGDFPVPLSTMSSLFDSGGQQAMLKISVQPRITLKDDTRGYVAPVVIVVGEDGQEHLPMAMPEITVSIKKNPNMGAFADGSVTVQRARGGMATFDSLWVTRAATRNEPGASASTGPRGYEEVYSLEFSAAGFTPVESAQFDVTPLIQVVTQPLSDMEITVPPVLCEGSSIDGCTAAISGYLPAGHVVRRALLDLDVSCTDFDSPGEAVASVLLGGIMVPRGGYQPGPWPGCGFAGCRGECDSNMRHVLSGYDVSHVIGQVDPRTGIYSTDGRDLTIAMTANSSVNICPCDNGAQLRAKATLRITVSERVQGAPLSTQPRLSLTNGDGTPYVMPTTVSAVIDSAHNLAQSWLEGIGQVQSMQGVAAFTNLAVAQGGDGFRLLFSLVHTPNMRSTISEPFGVGFGHFPKLTIDCDTCVKPRISTGERNKLQPSPVLQLQVNNSGVVGAASTYLPVHVRLGLNGPGGFLDGDLVVGSILGKVTFDGLKIFNGNCADMSAACGGLCGDGYTLIFTVNGNSAETTPFNVNGHNRSPRWLEDGSEPSGSSFNATVGIPMRPFMLKAADPNYDAVSIVQKSLYQGVVIANAPFSTPPPNSVAACPRPVADGPLLSDTRGSIATVMYTPTCSALPATFPSPRTILDVCFVAVDTAPMIDSVFTTTTESEERCVEVEVFPASRPVFTAPYHKDARSMHDTSSMRAAAQAGCLLELPITVEEHGLDANGAPVVSTLQIQPHRTTVTSVYEQQTLGGALPEGATMNVTSASAGSNTGVFRWRPVRGQEGFTYTICFRVLSVYNGTCANTFYTADVPGDREQFCIDVEVERCRYCPGAEGHGLSDLAAEWGTTWLQIYAGNNGIADASILTAGMPIDMGVVAAVSSGDSLAAVALKFGVTVELLLEWNPDLRTEAARGAGQALLSSDGLYEPGMAPWSKRGGVAMPDDQELCVLPDICTAAVVVAPEQGVELGPNGTVVGGAEGAPRPQQEPFNCDSCELLVDAFCGGPICLQGNGPPPWDEASCTMMGTSRCENCRMCRREVLDGDGRVIVPGEYRQGGCVRELDSICVECDACKPGEYEVQKCTPLTNRVCAPFTSKQGGIFLPV